uniref:Uncharacterized protein n=1 Tax=viral metagenome TaxID=1070528 RepID=A0A6C0CC38_9ZZZZ
MIAAKQRSSKACGACGYHMSILYIIRMYYASLAKASECYEPAMMYLFFFINIIIKNDIRALFIINKQQPQSNQQQPQSSRHSQGS